MCETNLVSLLMYSDYELDWQCSAMLENAVQAHESGDVKAAFRYLYRELELEAEEATRHILRRGYALDGRRDPDYIFRELRRVLIEESVHVFTPGRVETIGRRYSDGGTVIGYYDSKRAVALAG